MTQRTAQQTHTEAIGWHLRLRDAESADWDAFVEWLEQDPANSDAFDEVQFAEAVTTPEAVPEYGRPEPADDDNLADAPLRAHPGRRGAWPLSLGALAAALLVAILVWPLFGSRGPDSYEIATAAGQRRTIDLGDGSQVVLNGNTRLVLDHNDPRSVELASGEATFSVRHDASHPFSIVAGNHRLQDVGTRFNLIRDNERFEVAVIEGSVLYDPDGARLLLAAGQALTVRGGGRPVLSHDEPMRFAGWQGGRLNCRSAPLAEVVADLSRTLGVSLRVGPTIRPLTFTGSIRIERDPGATLEAFAATLGLHARREGNGWLFEPQARAPR